MQNKLKNVLFYGGLDKQTYNKYRRCILDEDSRNLSSFMLVMGIAFLVLGAISMTTHVVSDVNVRIYLGTGMAILILYLLQKLFIQSKINNAYIQDAFIYVFIAEIYAESIILTICNATKPAVTYIAAFLMLPIIFGRKPINMVVFQTVATAIFCVLVFKFKSLEIAQTDIWNAVTFLLIGDAAIAIVVPVRIKNTVQRHLIKELSEHDILTGLKNRNSFEDDCDKLRESGEKVVVVYADANGLHEINNNKGHEKGDALLVSIANSLLDAFGMEISYRTGGDEFIVVCPGGSLLWAEGLVNYASKNLQKEGYSAAFGCAESESGESLDSVIKRAESQMYSAKSKYYMEKGRDRRRR